MTGPSDASPAAPRSGRFRPVAAPAGRASAPDGAPPPDRRTRRGRVLIKVGGSVLPEGLPPGLLEGLARLHRAGPRPVVVHGGGPEVSRMTARLGHEPRFADGLRVTDDATLEVVEMVLAGGVNKRLVARLRGSGIAAVGLSGIDGGLLGAHPHPEAERLGHVGEIRTVDTGVVEALLARGYLPVVAPLSGDAVGRRYNVNADRAAAALAGSLAVDRLIMVTDVDGLIGGDDRARPVERIGPGRARRWIEDGTISRGMIPKVEACLAALEASVPFAHVVGAPASGADLAEVAAGRGGGTTIVPDGRGAGSPDAVEDVDGDGAAGGGGANHLFGNYGRLPVAFRRGEGVHLWDVAGREYLDFLGGIAVSSLGHSHPDLVAALRTQAARLLHVSNLYRIPEQAEAADRVARATGLDRVFFCNSGTEAVEAALKLARKRGRAVGGEEKHEILVAENAFHGRTFGALAATANPDYRDPFRPLPGGFRRVPFGDLGAAREAAGPGICAILVEPIQGEGGVVPAPPGYLPGLETLAHEHDALFLLDEVQTGVGRTGAPFAFQRTGASPDAVALAKGLGGGVPVGALAAREEVAAFLEPGDHASTFGGNPLASVGASTVLRVLRRDSLSENAASVGRHLRDALRGLAADGAPVEEVRGAGLLVGADVGVPAASVMRAALERGLLVGTAGPSTVRLAPPLVATESEADRAVELLRDALIAVAA